MKVSKIHLTSGFTPGELPPTLSSSTADSNVEHVNMLIEGILNYYVICFAGKGLNC